MTRESEIQARLDAAHDTPWQPYFNIHGDPVIAADLDRLAFTTVATVATASPDYGRANALLLGNAPADIEYLLERNEFLLDKVASQERHITLLRSLLVADEQKTAADRFVTYTQTDTVDRQMQDKTVPTQPTQEELERFFNNG